MQDDVENLTLLGSQKTEYRTHGARHTMLETFPNQFPSRDYMVSHVTEEFTSLCPKTGQPDFATIKINFVPDAKLVESKSLKLYLFAYRGEGTFMETITNRILSDLVAVMEPRRCHVEAIFAARGGIQTIVNASYEKESDMEQPLINPSTN